MARKRPAEFDYVCERCSCPCDHTRHLGGGQNMRACKGPVRPVLRAEHEAAIAAAVDYVTTRREA